MDIALVENLETIPAGQWNALTGGITNPFLRHEFLAGLERFGCVGERWGWLPHHIIARQDGRVIGAVPLYLKTNSYGEFVFDWSWADAYRRANLAYYPKLVAAVPYTPATGARLLLAADAPADTPDELIRFASETAARLQVSTLHWLFPPENEAARLQTHGLLRRTGTQFHWFNQRYRDFDDFLDTFTAEKRKKVKRERRRVLESGVQLEVLTGHEISDEQWGVFHRFYASTFDKHGGYATLTEAFFRWLGRALPDQVVLVLARHQGQYVAGAFNMRSHDTLYGRHWGSWEEFHSLHFEACYYTGLEYCIREGLRRFEPGAQGEHKVSRGFVPMPTYSAHWIANPVFRRALGEYLSHEQEAVEAHRRELNEHAPFKTPG
jgi:hypothetical protein